MQESEDFLHWPFCRCLGMRTDPEKWNQERSRTDAPRVWLLSSYPLCAPLTFPRRFMNKPNNLLFTITFAFLRWTDFRFRIYCPAIQWAFHICEASLTKTNVSTPILPSFVFRLSKQGSFSSTALNVPILYIACSSYEATSFAGYPINCVNSVLLTKGIRTVVRDRKRTLSWNRTGVPWFILWVGIKEILPDYLREGGRGVPRKRDRISRTYALGKKPAKRVKALPAEAAAVEFIKVFPQRNSLYLARLSGKSSAT